MSSNQQAFKQGQSYDQVDQADEWMQSNKDSTNACMDRSCAGIQTGNTEWDRPGNRTGNQTANYNNNEWSQQGTQPGNMNNNEWSQQGTQPGNMNNNEWNQPGKGSGINNEWNQPGARSANNDQWNQQGRDAGNPGFLQQTGEQVLHMAQGAVDTVKNKLGMKDDKY